MLAFDSPVTVQNWALLNAHRLAALYGTLEQFHLAAALAFRPQRISRPGVLRPGWIVALAEPHVVHRCRQQLFIRQATEVGQPRLLFRRP